MTFYYGEGNVKVLLENVDEICFTVSQSLRLFRDFVFLARAWNYFFLFLFPRCAQRLILQVEVSYRYRLRQFLSNRISSLANPHFFFSTIVTFGRIPTALPFVAPSESVLFKKSRDHRCLRVSNATMAREKHSSL